ncbi:MAG: hypothetical protein QME74_06325, partial [Candidatus Edwardsbacteria bacterium]|nr:hypothetical protein [Candidatus Edwardsbacteria bacterium]
AGGTESSASTSALLSTSSKEKDKWNISKGSDDLKQATYRPQHIVVIHTKPGSGFLISKIWQRVKVLYRIFEHAQMRPYRIQTHEEKNEHHPFCPRRFDHPLPHARRADGP